MGNLTRGARGAKIGAVTAALKDAMGRAGTSFDERQARMVLAQYILDRPVRTYNDLSDDELTKVETMSSNNRFVDSFVRIHYGWADELL